MKKTKPEESNIVNDIDMLSVSSCELTGFIPFGPENPFQLDSYKDMYPFRADCLKECQKNK